MLSDKSIFGASEIDKLSEIPNIKFKIADRVSEMATVSEMGVFWVREVLIESDRLKLSLRVNPNPNVENRTLSDNEMVSNRIGGGIKNRLLITLPSDSARVSPTD